MRLFIGATLAALSLVSVARAEEVRRPPQVAVTDWLNNEVKNFHQKNLDPLFGRLPECKGVRLVKIFDLEPEDAADVWLTAHFIQRQPAMEVTYDIEIQATRTSNHFRTIEPETAVRLACLAAKAAAADRRSS